MKTKPSCLPPEPTVFAGTGKRGLQTKVIRRAEIDGASGVVLAATGHGADPQDIVDALAAGEFAADDERTRATLR